MIILRDLTKIYKIRGRRKTVACGMNAVFPSGISVGLLGRNGAGKSTLLKLIAGSADPTSGHVITKGRTSFPVGFAGSFHPDMTGAQNTRFVARIYGADTSALIDYVADFADLDIHFHLPFRTYSAGMKSRLAFGVSMGLKFDTYLIDEITAVGDARFKQKSQQIFMDRLTTAGAVFVSHSNGMLRELCTTGAVIEGGKLTYFDDVNDAIAHYKYSTAK